ncbi:DNA gyrase C-terminal beta-propeller domain-containing protein, partial [Ureaplasma urealyticum]
ISCMRWKDVGEHLNNYAKFDANEKVVAVYVCNEQFKVDEHQLVLGSKLNLIKRIELNELDLNKNSKQISIMKLNENDGLISANLIKKDHNQFVVAISKLGLVLMFLVHEINCLNRLAKGIKIMKLKPNDEISSILIVPNNGYSIQLFLDQGNKCFSISELKLSKRAMTPSPLYLPTKKAQSVLAAFLVGNENVFYLLDEQQK